VDLAEFVALRNERGPDALHHAVATPALEPAVNGRVIAELPGQSVPLAGGAEAVDDAIEDAAPVGGGLPALGAGLPVLLEDGFDPCPEVIGDLPDGIQGLGLGLLPGHEGTPSKGSPFIQTEAIPGHKAGSEIVSKPFAGR
jgi:hypothetical protein